MYQDKRQTLFLTHTPHIQSLTIAYSYNQHGNTHCCLLIQPTWNHSLFLIHTANMESLTVAYIYTPHTITHCCLLIQTPWNHSLLPIEGAMVCEPWMFYVTWAVTVILIFQEKWDEFHFNFLWMCNCMWTMKGNTLDYCSWTIYNSMNPW